MKKKERRQGEDVKLEMTPMIDVVFQLLIFFLVTLKQEDIISQLKIMRPAPNSVPSETVVKDLLTITVYRQGVMLGPAPMTFKELSSELGRIKSKDITVKIQCTGDSPHASLVRVLDLCTKVGLSNLAVFSL